jgi:hypothetical protein
MEAQLAPAGYAALTYDPTLKKKISRSALGTYPPKN